MAVNWRISLPQEKNAWRSLLVLSISLNVYLLYHWPSRALDCEAFARFCSRDERFVHYLDSDKDISTAGIGSVSPFATEPPSSQIVDISEDWSGNFFNGVTDGRQLHSSGSNSSSSSSSSGSSGSSHAAHAEHDHSYLALLFMLSALMIGVLILHIQMWFPKVQFTVALFLIGLIIAVCIEGWNLDDDLGKFGTSWNMWVKIDPHLLLYTLLPALLAGDAMTIDTYVFLKKVAPQVWYLAGPGVGIQAGIVACFFYGYMSAWNWSFELCMVVGSILCATDPVAVVALLKDLGASPVLTVLIQGESLFNDGTAIVFFLISYNILSGETYRFDELILFIVQKVLMAIAVGLFIGFFFYYWIRFANDRFSHSSSFIQILLTICCAYWSFMFSEGILDMSGVLATVVSSLVLAHYMWPHVVDKTSMHDVWHTIEAVGNIIIFFLAGCLTGVAMTNIDSRAWIDLIVIYIVLVLVRTGFLYASCPLLSCIGDPVDLKKATVMSWGGLRGAVGLALAIQVEREKAMGNVNPRDATHVLFYVGGIACLTLLINATTCGALVNFLGITAMPQEHLRLLKMVYGALANLSKGDFPEEFKSICGITPGVEKFPEEVTNGIQGLMHHITDRISHMQVAKKKMSNMRLQSNHILKDNKIIIEEFREVREKYNKRREVHREKKAKAKEKGEIAELSIFKNLGGHKSYFKDLGQGQQAKDIDAMCDLLIDKETDIGMAQAVNSAFLKLVEKNYWQLMEEEVLRLGSDLSHSLLFSVRVAQGRDKVGDLCDFEEMESSLPQNPTKSPYTDALDPFMIFPIDSEVECAADGRPPLVHRIVSSAIFNITFIVLIIANCITVIFDEVARDEHNKDHIMWLTIEITFNACFLVEFCLKFWDRGFAYFTKPADLFDFFLLCMGALGIICDIVMTESTDLSSVHILRFARIFRVLRLLRVFRLISVKMDMGRDVSVEVEYHMHVLTAMVCFSTAHLKAQRDLIIFFGGNAKIDVEDEKEIGRCVIQSQMGVYKACLQAINQEDFLAATKPTVLSDLRVTLLSKRIVDGISRFIDAAHEAGAMCQKDAHEVRHPVNHYLQDIKNMLTDLDAGIVDSHFGRISSLSSKSVNLKMKFTGNKPSGKVAPAPLNESVESTTLIGAGQLTPAENGEQPETLVQDVKTGELSTPINAPTAINA